MILLNVSATQSLNHCQTVHTGEPHGEHTIQTHSVHLEKKRDSADWREESSLRSGFVFPKLSESCFKYLATTVETRLSAAHATVKPEMSPDPDATAQTI